MSYHAYREDSTESESDEEDSTHKTNPQYESISGDSSSDPPSPSPPTDDFDYSQYLTGPGSQTASYVSKLAGKCNVAQLKRILPQYGVMGLSKARKPFLIKKAVECHSRLDETMKKRFQATLADPSGKELTVTSTIDDDSPDRGGRSSRSSSKNFTRARKPPARPRSPEYSDDEDEDDYSKGEMAPLRQGPSRSFPASDSESSTSHSPDIPEQVITQPSASNIRDRNVTSPTQIPRNRIVLTLPKYKNPNLEAPPIGMSTSSSTSQRSAIASTSGRYDLPNQSLISQSTNKSPVRPYVPRTSSTNPPSTSSTANNSSGAWPPPLPVDNNQRKRSSDHFGAVGNSASVASNLNNAKRFVLNAAQPTMLRQVAPPAPYIPTSSHTQSFSFFPGQASGFPIYPQLVPANNSGSSVSHNANSTTVSSNQMSALINRPSASQASARYPQSFSAANSNLYSNTTGSNNYGSAQEAEYSARITHLMRSLSDDPGMAPHSPNLQARRRDFLPASALQTSRDPRTDPRTAYSNGMSGIQHRHSDIHPYQPSNDSTPQRAVQMATQQQQPIRSQQSCVPANGSSIMNNNPFAAAFSNGHTGPPLRTNSDETIPLEASKASIEAKLLRFKVEWPSIPNPVNSAGNGGRVIKPPVFHETLWQVREPLSIRRDQTLTTRGVYREIIMTFYFNQNNVNVNDSNTVVLFRFCQELPSLSAYEMHPDNLKLMLNGKTLVEPAIVDFSNRMKKKKNAVFNQPIEVGLPLLAQQNVVLIRWTEDGAQTGQPVAVPEEPPKDYYLIVECARRKSMEDILQTVSTNRVPIQDTVYRLYQTLGGGDDDIVTDSQKVSLHCPASRSRLTIPVRGRNCDHIDCFDVSAFLFMNRAQKARWTCPKCNKPVQFDEIVLDEFMQTLLTTFPNCEAIDATLEDTEIVVREAKKPQKSDNKPVETINKSSNSSSCSNGTISLTNKPAPSNKTPPEIITLD